MKLTCQLQFYDVPVFFFLLTFYKLQGRKQEKSFSGQLLHYFLSGINCKDQLCRGIII